MRSRHPGQSIGQRTWPASRNKRARLYPGRRTKHIDSRKPLQAAVLFAEPLIELIPLGVLVGLIFSVVLDTFDVRTFEYFFVLPVADRYLRAGLGMFVTQLSSAFLARAILYPLEGEG